MADSRDRKGPFSTKESQRLPENVKPTEHRSKDLSKQKSLGKSFGCKYEWVQY